MFEHKHKNVLLLGHLFFYLAFSLISRGRNPKKYQSRRGINRASSYRQGNLIVGSFLLRFLGLCGGCNNGSMVNPYDLFCNMKADLGTSRRAAKYLSGVTILCGLFDDYDTSNCTLGLLFDGELLVELVGWVAEEGIGEVLLCLELLI